MLLFALGLVGIAAVKQQTQRTALVPVASVLSSESGDGELVEIAGRFHPVASYRSLEQCYELTSELPGVKPLQASIWVALDWWQHYFRLAPNREPDARYHERGFGLNPLMVEACYQA